MSTYVIITYIGIFVACLAGAFSNAYCANLLQRVALSTLAFWTVWRMGLIYERGYSTEHEAIVGTALALYAIGSLVKTLKFNRGVTE